MRSLSVFVKKLCLLCFLTTTWGAQISAQPQNGSLNQALYKISRPQFQFGLVASPRSRAYSASTWAPDEKLRKIARAYAHYYINNA
jgi:hypothetical protein